MYCSSRPANDAATIKAASNTFDESDSLSGQSSSDTTEPRSMRFPWSMKTTSSLEPEAILEKVTAVLRAHDCRYEYTEQFTILCSHGSEDSDLLVQWEMEVCRLPRLSLNGIRFQRIAGPAISFKNIATKITNDLSL